jgi:3-deoxy-7-phosphoheptulonate synthase
MSLTTQLGSDLVSSSPDHGTGTWPAHQQPRWRDSYVAETVQDLLSRMPALVTAGDVETLTDLLEKVARGQATVVQFGDCAEDPAADAAAMVSARLELAGSLADAARAAGLRSPMVLVGRIAGQYAKPRSVPTERIGEQEVPVYRGHMLNRPEVSDRHHNAWHMLGCFSAALHAMAHLGWFGRSRTAHRPPTTLWTSHEALVLDYEMPLVRSSRRGPYLSSTHWPWIGDRTRNTDGPHVRLLSNLANPVAVKLGPSTTPAEAVALCRILNLDRLPGRLTFIARMGVHKVDLSLPRILEAVQNAGQPVVWMCDPMHGNTHKQPCDTKVRYVDEIIGEVDAFVDILASRGAWPAGLHLEATPEDVQECQASRERATLGVRTSLCDPRLNSEQALEVVAAWAARMSELEDLTRVALDVRTAS